MMKNTLSVNKHKNFVVFLGFFCLQVFLFSCSGSDQNNQAGKVFTEQDFISTYVDKDLGARLSIDDSLSLLIPPGALPESQIITLQIFKNSQAYTHILEFEPRGLLFSKPLSLEIRIPFGLNADLVEIYSFNDQLETVLDRDEAPIVENVAFTLDDRWLSTEINQFAPLAVFGTDLLNIVFQLPSQFLLPGDIEYNLNQDNRWQTGHARLYLGFDIESSPMEVTLATGEQEFLSEEQKTTAENEIRNTLQTDFPFVETFIQAHANAQAAVYINNNHDFRNDRSQWLYLGAKRRVDMPWQSRIELAVESLQQEGKAYFPVGVTTENGFSSTSLVQFVYQAVGFAIAIFDNQENFNLSDNLQNFVTSPLPVLHFKSEDLVDINEITVYESGTDGLIIPIYGVSRASSVDLKAYEQVAVSASVVEGNEELLDNFDEINGELDLSFIYQKEDQTPWQITFTLEVTFNSKVYTKERTLTINVADARPVFSDNFLGLNVAEHWTSDSSQIDGSDGVVLNQVAGVLSITTPIPLADCDSHFLWTPELTLPGNFSIEYEFVKNGFGRSALLVTSDGVRDLSANDNALEFYIASDSSPYLGVVNRESGVDTSMYQIDNTDYLNVPLVIRIDRVAGEYHFYINGEKIPQVFTNTVLDSDTSLTIAIETSVCATDSGNAVDRVNAISVSNGASVGFEGFALSSLESAYGDNHDVVCANEFGSAWSMADWTQLEDYFSDEKDLTELVTQVGFVDKPEAWILREGDASLDVIKDYFVAYHNREKPDSFASYDDIDENFFDLGAAFTDKFVLCSDL